MPLSLEFDYKYEGSVDIGNYEGIGLDRVIFTMIDTLLSPPLIEAVEIAEGEAKAAAQDALNKARLGWEKLSYAIGKGVVEHITANMEIYGIHTQGNVNTSASGSIASALTGSLTHTHGINNLTGEQTNLEFIQNNDGTGHVR